MRITQMDRHHKGAQRSKATFSRGDPRPTRKRETHTGVSTSETKALRRKVVGGDCLGASRGCSPNPGRSRRKHAALHVETRRHLLPPLSLVTVWTRLWGSRDPKDSLAPTVPDRRWARWRGGGIAELQPPRPGARGRVESAARPVRSGAPRANRFRPPLPGSLRPRQTCPAAARSRSGASCRAALSSLGPERAVQRRLRVSRPRAARATRSRPRPQSRA